MSVQFSRSLRSLNLDSFRAARIGLLLAIVNMMALLLWFTLAEVTLYEVSSELRLEADGRLVAVFNPDGVARIYPGQAALLRIDAGPDQPLVTIPALVVDVERRNNTVELLLMSDEASPEALSEELLARAEVEVEVEHVTPAALVLRASGKYLGGSSIPVSPGTFERGEP